MARERPLREGAYSGGSQMGVPFPSDDDERDDDERTNEDQEPDEPAADDDNDQGDDDDGDQGGRAPARPAKSGLAGAGAGWVLGVLLWGWIVLPFMKGGPTQVRNTLRAKFVNRAPDGSPLP